MFIQYTFGKVENKTISMEKGIDEITLKVYLRNYLYFSFFISIYYLFFMMYNKTKGKKRKRK